MENSISTIILSCKISYYKKKNEYYCTIFTDSFFFFFFIFSFIELSFINLEPLYFSIQREKIITSLFRKLTKISTNNFKIDINGISDLLEMCKNIISA